MKILKLNEKEVEKFFQQALIRYSTPVSEKIVKELSTEDVKVISAFLGDKSESTAGTLIGYAKISRPIIVSTEQFQAETDYVRFYYKICNSYGEYQVTENMQTIQAAFPVLDSIPDEDFRVWRKAQNLLDEKPWGAKGFWEYTPTETLTGDDLYCRRFIERVQEVSQTHQWGSYMTNLFNTKDSEQSVLENRPISK